MTTLPFPLVPAAAVLLSSRAESLAALERAGWTPRPPADVLDAERRRLLNLDLGDADAAFSAQGDVVAVARLETDRAGLVTLVEITAALPVSAEDVAATLLPDAGEPRVGGDVQAREWVWGPETGATSGVSGEPVRLWICAERAYGDRLWAVLSVVRRASDT